MYDGLDRTGFHAAGRVATALQCGVPAGYRLQGSYDNH